MTVLSLCSLLRIPPFPSFVRVEASVAAPPFFGCQAPAQLGVMHRPVMRGHQEAIRDSGDVRAQASLGIERTFT